MKITLKDFAPQPHMQFEPVQEDDDELSKAIQDDNARQEDNWDLTDDLDGDKLAAFWDEAVKDLSPVEAQAAED